MERISFVKSLMEFDKRVLYQGTPAKYKPYTLNELKTLLFFNSVFASNIDELFERHCANSIIDDYVKLLNQYISNIAQIIQQMMIQKREIRFTREDTFERRFSMYSQIAKQTMTSYFRSIEEVSYRFTSGGIYYFSILTNGGVAITFIDPRRELYQQPLCHKIGDNILYWKTDDCVRDYMTHSLDAIGTIAAKITVSNKNPKIITKVEFSGSNDIAKMLMPLFGKRALMVSNPFLYTDDIKQIISANSTEQTPEEMQEFKSIEALDMLEDDELIEYPKDSFNDYLAFLKSAAMNPEVTSIYLTLYRIGTDPAIFYILRDAVRRGVKVHVNIELCASGEDINKIWMEEMMNVGIRVTTYQVGVLKVHSKLTLVKFNNGRSIAQIGTGNYHTKTTTQYTDLSLITADEDICHQVEKVFHIFKGKEEVSFNDNFLVTRYNARETLIDLIDDEAEKGEKGYICIKCNALDDDEIIKHLDEAASMGCRMDLIVRGVCTWVPYELDSTVQVKSIVWDKLEHSRVYCFGNRDPKVYMGSLDPVTSKLDKRIETLVKINDPKTLIKICDYLNRYITNTKGSWVMTQGGVYVKE